MLSPEEFTKGTAAAAEAINSIVLKTPLLKSKWLSKLTSCNVYLKMESEQITRSFKLRGASNKMVKESKKGSKKVICASSGNHGTACLQAASQLGMYVSVYCPLSVNQGKADAILEFENAELIKYGNDCAVTEAYARKCAADQNIPYVSPYNDIDVILGASTVGQELLQDLPDLDAVFIAVGGGGFASGVCAYLKYLKPSVVTVGCQPENNCAMYECIKAGHILEDNSFLRDTIAEGVAGGVEVDAITFDYCKKFVDEWVLSPEEDIEKAVYDLLDKEKKVVEGAAGLPIAALTQMKNNFKGKNIALIICGGNINTSKITELCSKFLS